MSEVLSPLKGAISLSQALPEEKDRYDLKAGVEFAITGILITHRQKWVRAKKPGEKDYLEEWDTVHMNGLTLPDGAEFVKYKSSAAAVVRKCKDLLTAACFATGNCKVPVKVRAIQKDGDNGPYLDLEDA